MATEAKTKANLGTWLSIELVFGALAFVVCTFFPPELRSAARIATGCALASGLVALFAVHAGYDHGTNGLLGGFAGGMFARMILLGIGFFASGARGNTALAFTFTFFALYLLTVGTEIAYVLTRQRAKSLARAA